MSGFRLKRLDIAAFRGVGEKVRIPLDRPLNVIFGPNGSGKSTLLTAIEWVLFPSETVRLKESGIDERRSWEVRHIHTRDYPDVTLLLEGDGVEIPVRQYGKKGSTRRASITCAYADFKYLVHVHQETLRDFLVGPPGPRQSALGRLLGAGWAQDLSSGLNRARRELKCEEANRKVGELERLLTAKMAEVNRLAIEEKQRAKGQGLGEPWRSAARYVHAEIGRQVADLCQRAEVAVPELPELEPMGDYARRLSDGLAELRRAGPAHQQTELAGRKARLDSAGAAYVTAKNELDDRLTRLAGLKDKTGGLEAIEAKLAETKRGREELKGTMTEADRRRAVMVEAIEFFRQHPGETECPVCGNDVAADLPGRMEKRLAEMTAGLDDGLRNKASELAEQAELLAGQAEQIAHLMSAVVRARDRLDEEGARLLGTLQQPPGEDEDLLAFARQEAKRLAANLARLRQAVDDWLQSLAEIGDEARKLDTIHRILELEERLRKLGAIRHTQEWEDMIEQQRLLSLREQHYRLSVARLGEMSARLAAVNLEHVSGPISTIYSRLSQRADFDAVTIDPEKKYEVVLDGAAARWSPTSVLNLTDLNSLAIAVIAGMAVTFRETTDLDFLILDDPSQGMDASVAGRLGETLGELARSIQLVVATPDPNLLDKLERCSLPKNIVRLQPRDPASREPSVCAASTQR